MTSALLELAVRPTETPTPRPADAVDANAAAMAAARQALRDGKTETEAADVFKEVYAETLTR